jgi:hypothetical protein
MVRKATDVLEAARNIISAIQRREVVHRLDIGNSSMGDEGCVQLFNFLDSPAGRRCKHSLTELYLTRNGIGAKGLLAVSKFIKDNDVLRELCLSGVSMEICGVLLLKSLNIDTCLMINAEPIIN